MFERTKNERLGFFDELTDDGKRKNGTTKGVHLYRLD